MAGVSFYNLPAVSTSNLLLDDYPNAAAAYSLRLIRKTYSGSAIRVRRASDNAEQDIGFTGNNLDTPALISFCTGTNGLVTTWYDQSGNARNATQTIAASQPKIYDSATGVISENSKAAVGFDGLNDFFETSYQPNLGTASTASYYISSVIKSNASHTGRIWSSQLSSGSGVVIHLRYETTQYRSFTRDTADVIMSALGGTTTTNQINLAALIKNGNANVYVNGTSVVSASAAFTGNLTTADPFEIGRFSGNLDYLNAKCQELIFYTSDQSTNRTGIETNINNYYNIYP